MTDPTYFFAFPADQGQLTPAQSVETVIAEMEARKAAIEHQMATANGPAAAWISVAMNHELENLTHWIARLRSLPHARDHVLTTGPRIQKKKQGLVHAVKRFEERPAPHGYNYTRVIYFDTYCPIARYETWEPTEAQRRATWPTNLASTSGIYGESMSKDHWDAVDRPHIYDGDWVRVSGPVTCRTCIARLKKMEPS